MNVQREFLLLVTLAAAVDPRLGATGGACGWDSQYGAQGTASVPDFSGVWHHGNLPWLIPPGPARAR